MDLEKFSELTKSLESLLAMEFLFPVNLAASEPRFIVLFSVLLLFVGLVMSLYLTVSVWSKMWRWSKFDLFLTLNAAPFMFLGIYNTTILFTPSPGDWKETDRYQSYVELAEFLNQSRRYAQSPFEVKRPNGLDFIHLQRTAKHEIWKATEYEVSRKLLGKRDLSLDLQLP